MSTRLEALTIDARDPKALALWWAEAVGWTLFYEDDGGGEYDLCERIDPDGSHPYPELTFVRVADPEAGQERIHIDLNSFTAADQQATVDRLLEMGATRADVGQPDDAPFVVLADPEGNHFCVLDPRPEYGHLGSIAGYTLAAHDAQALMPIWHAVTGWEVTRDEPGYVVLTPPDGGAPLEIITRPTMEHDDAKVRIHLDVAPSLDEDQQAVVARLESLGAKRAEVGQTGDEAWVVLTDPEGNEFCVLSPRA